MTPRQLRVFKFLRDFIRKNSYAPSLEEIASHMKVCKITVRQYLEALERHGVISRKRYGCRSIEIVSERYHMPESTELPLIGYIAAGSPIEAVEIPETLDIGEEVKTGAELFALKVKGDSMVEEGILDGDYVIVEKRETAQNGQVVVALLDDGMATLKKFYREKNRIKLKPANERLKPVFVRSVTIQGIVKGVFRPL